MLKKLNPAIQPSKLCIFLNLQNNKTAFRLVDVCDNLSNFLMVIKQIRKIGLAS